MWHFPSLLWHYILLQATCQLVIWDSVADPDLSLTGSGSDFHIWLNFFPSTPKIFYFSFFWKRKLICLNKYCYRIRQNFFRVGSGQNRSGSDQIRIRNTDTKNQIYSCIPVCFLLMCQKSCSKLCTVRSFCWQLLANSLFCNIHTHTHTHWYYIQITMAVDSNIIIVIKI